MSAVIFELRAWSVVRALAVFAVLVGSNVASAPAANAERGAMVSEMLAGVNQARVSAGLAVLPEDAALDGLAFERSSDMLTRHYFSHTTPDGLTVFALMEQRGVNFHFAGENLAWNTYNERDTTRIALQSFLTSPGHRANMLNPDFSKVGVGVATDGGNTYFTLVFVG